MRGSECATAQQAQPAPGAFDHCEDENIRHRRAALLEQLARFTDGMSGSEIVESALKRWLTERRRRQLEAEIAA